MSKGKKIEIRMNGKKTNLTHHDTKPDEKYSIKEFNKEHAATIEDSDIPELIRQDSDDPDNEIYFTRKPRFKMFKPFLLAALSAIIVGSILGFFMLNMFVDINDDISRQGDSPPLAAAGGEDDEGDSTDDEGGNDNSGGNEETSPVTTEAINPFILQAGKFGEKANADEMAAALQQTGFPAMIWEKDNFFFVIAGITNSREQGTQLASTFAEDDFEVYVTEWGVPSGDLELPPQEKEWLQMFEEQWNGALAAVSDGNQLSQDAWADVVSEIPENTEQITDFTQFLREQHQQMGEADIWQDRVILLNLLEQFSQLVLQ
ncbi:SPOR domain-containing protein [Lentibacillus sp. CBA3610]|uniref:SPOR domain-containing protein n=1 Tax=Lentibacillus sp. CBA3610 TaxID=2518176 RepID=UPI001595FBD7|nr:SPOR domain-containing protein [Lentibacillus sp. CBA3610]QKY69584.1 SPOR domain-containing protein [Lentibacillus sp. CBA3610]